MIKKLIPIAILFLIATSSCQIIQNLSVIYSTEVEYNDYRSQDKQMRFVKMHHIGKQAFYDNVVKEISAAKKDGYVLFYELIEDADMDDLAKRKFRKFYGFLPSPEGYKNMSESADASLVAQNNDWFMNLENDLDFNVDLTGLQVIAAYEKMYGELELTDEDLNTPLSEKINTVEPSEQVETIISGQRDKHLAEEIENSSYAKIIVIYGRDHESGLFKQLKALNVNWVKEEM